MSKKRSRLAILGVAALSICLAVGLTSGAAEAKKKGKKKAAKTVTASHPASTAVAQAPTNGAATARIPLTVGKKAKGKVVAPSSVELTFSLTGPPVTIPNDGDLGHLAMRLTAPNGRTVPPTDGEFDLNYPDDHNASAIGPVTLSANSPIGPCTATIPPPPPPCAFDPDSTLLAPYAGTMGETELALFAGLSAKGTWTLTVRNFQNDKAFTVGPVSHKVPLQNKPQ
jgi:hypothetical protein